MDFFHGLKIEKGLKKLHFAGEIFHLSPHIVHTIADHLSNGAALTCQKDHHCPCHMPQIIHYIGLII